MNKKSYIQPSKGITLSNKLRRLWEEHIMWTRSFINSTVDETPDLKFVTERLLENPTDFANLLKQYYGEAKAKRFEELLREHLLIGGDLVVASKENETMRVKELRRKWRDNADEIARFLSSINPFWRYNMWRESMYEHLDMTEKEAGTRIMGQYGENVRIYDDIQSQALGMADMMSDGIRKQFGIN